MLTVYDRKEHVAKANVNVGLNTWAQRSRHVGNSLTSVCGALKKNDTGRVVITARVKGTGKKMKSLLFKGSARESCDGWQVWR